MRKLIVPMMMSAGALLGAAGVHAAETAAHGALSIAVFGDSPYGTSDSDTAQFDATPAFIQAINSDRDVSLVLHVGDIHSGKQSCSYGYDQSIYTLWTAFTSPLVYTPGDNEWTDGHKSKEGSQPPLDNLGYVRSLFFANPGHTLGADMSVQSQHDHFDPKYPSDAEYVENVMWERSKVMFVTLNIPGGSNNDADNWFGLPRADAQTSEALKRTGADLRWLDRAFAQAEAGHDRAVVIGVQADMWDLDGKDPAEQHIGNYRRFIDAIAMKAAAFRKPVLLINGDSHGYRSDNPLVEGAPCVTESGATEVACSDDAYDSHANGYRVKNFHRIVVHGSKAPMEWVKLVIQPGEGDGRRGPDSFGPFSWTRMVTDLPPAP